MAEHAYLDHDWAERLVRAYGMDAFDMLAGAKDIADLGICFGGTLYAREVDWLRQHEWAVTADDILWRRSKLGLVLDDQAATRLTAWLASASPLTEVA
jgi:glycerol-3-phosphate dehydrogenase